MLVLALLVGGAVAAWVAFVPRARMVQLDTVRALPSRPPELPTITPQVSVEEPEPGTELDAVINNQEGLRFYQTGRYDAALEQFSRAVQISPENAQYRRNYALTLLRLGRAQEAEEELRRSIRLDPNQAAAYANLAEARLELADTTGAMSALEQFLAVGTDPRLRGIAERQLRDLRIRSGAGEPGVIMDTATAAPPGDSAAPPPEDPPGE